MAQGAERIEGFIIIDKIIVRFFDNRIIGKCHRVRQPGHDTGQHGIGHRIGINTVFILDLAHVFIPALIIQIADLLVKVRIFRPYLEQSQPCRKPVPGQSLFWHYRA